MSIFLVNSGRKGRDNFEMGEDLTMDLCLAQSQKEKKKDPVKFMTDQAVLLGKNTESSLRVIIGNLVENVFQQFKLFPDEFEKTFKAGKISLLLVNEFVNNLSNGKEFDAEEVTLARNELFAFIENKYGVDKNASLSKEISKILLKYDVSVSNLFSE